MLQIKLKWITEQILQEKSEKFEWLLQTKVPGSKEETTEDCFHSRTNVSQINMKSESKMIKRFSQS